jgi:hypothetical protein
MMATDILMNSSLITTNAYPTWDFAVKDNMLQTVSGTNGDIQNANIAVFTQKGTIPQLPSAGVNSAGFLTNQISFGSFDANIRTALKNAGASAFVPKYSTASGLLKVSIEEGSTG